MYYFQNDRLVLHDPKFTGLDEEMLNWAKAQEPNPEEELSF